MKKGTIKKIEKAEKEINEAEEAVLDAVESADEETKEFLTRAAKNLGEAEAEVIESQG